MDKQDEKGLRTMQTFVSHFEQVLDEMTLDENLKIEPAARAGLQFLGCLSHAIYRATEATIEQLEDEAKGG